MWKVISFNVRMQEIACFDNVVEMLDYISQIGKRLKIKIWYEHD